MRSLRQRLRWWLFPGINLHARLRFHVLPSYFGQARGKPLDVLDAGCGNGMLTYRACRRGNRVLGVSIKQEEVLNCRRLFNEYLGISTDRLQFESINLYELDSLGRQFDEIICSEVLEHLVRDGDVVRSFFKLLRPGGVLHLCTPNADHPDNASSPLDPGETGGHVRPGYTLESYRRLLEPAGFRIVESRGIGGPIREFFNRRIIAAERAHGFWAGALLFLVAQLLVWLDPANPGCPYSIYVRVAKQADAAQN